MALKGINFHCFITLCMRVNAHPGAGGSDDDGNKIMIQSKINVIHPRLSPSSIHLMLIQVLISYS